MISIYLYQISVAVALRGCGNIDTTVLAQSSLIVNDNSHDWNRDIYHQGLSCQENPDCKAVTETTIGSVEAVCSASPGLMQPIEVYIVRRESDMPGNIKVLRSSCHAAIRIFIIILQS